MIGRSLQVLLPEPERSQFYTLLPVLLTDQPVTRHELLLLRADGSVVHTEVDSNPLLWDGQRQYLLVVRDLSIRKQTEEEQNKALFLIC